MALDFNLLQTQIDKFNTHKKFIDTKKNLLTFVNENNKYETSYNILRTHWQNDDFEPAEMKKSIEEIRTNRKCFKTTEGNLYSALGEFTDSCEFLYTTDDDTFEAFQAIMQNKTPLDGSIILRLYEKIFASLQNTAEYEEIHKKTNGTNLYQLFGFEPDSTIYTINKLKVLLEDEGEFNKDGYISKKGKWKDLKFFANVLKDKQSKENYDTYYRFLMCKTILRGVLRRNKNLVSYKYLEVVSELEKYKICNNSEQAKIVIGSFCDEIGLTWKFTTPEIVKKDEDRIRGLRIRIEEKVNQLKTRKKELESSLSGRGNEIDTLQKDIDSEINKMSSAIKTLKSSSKAIYKEDDKFEVLEQQVADLQKLKKKIKEVESFRDETQKNIAKEVKNADNKQEEITFDNVQAILNEVTAKEGVINKLFNEFIGKYNNEIIKVVQDGFRNAKSRFYNTEREINAEREQVKKKISEARKNLNKYTKPITKWFVRLQIGLFLLNFLLHWECIYFSLNLTFFIWYIIGVSRQFNKYNQAVFALKDISTEKVKYHSKAKFIWSITWVALFFVSVQIWLFHNDTLLSNIIGNVLK